MKLIQNILKIAFILLFFSFENKLLKSSADSLQTPDKFREIILSNNKKPFKIDKAHFGSVVIGGNGTKGQMIATQIPAQEITSIMQEYADKGLFLIPNSFKNFFKTSYSGNPGILVCFTIEQNSYQIIIAETNKLNYFIAPQNGIKFIAQNENDLIDSLQEKDMSTLPAEEFKKIIQNNHGYSFTINNAWYGASSNNINVTEQMQTYAKQGLFALPKDMNTFFGKDPFPNNAKTLFVDFTVRIGKNIPPIYEQHTVFIPENDHDAFFVPAETFITKMGKPFTQYYMITELASIQQQNPALTVPPSGPILFQTLDAYLEKISTAPTFQIKNGCWYGAAYDSKRRLTDIVQQSLQQHANKGLLAFPANMNQYFGKDPLPERLKYLRINFTMNDIAYTINIPDYNTFSPKSKYLYIIPEGTVNPLFLIQQTSETPEDLTAYLTQFNTKEKIEAEITRLLQSVPQFWETEEELIKFNAKLKALRDKLATLVQSQPDPFQNTSETLYVDTFKDVIINNRGKSFVINNAWYGTSSKNIDVTLKMQEYANGGFFLLPKNMNDCFKKDPVPGTPKTLFVDFTVQIGKNIPPTYKRYKISIPESNHDNFWIPAEIINGKSGPYMQQYVCDAL